MFESARLKLTIWYVLIIMAISIIFSLVIYRVQIGESERLLQRVRTRIEQRDVLRPGFVLPLPEPEIIEEAHNRLAVNLVLINLGILILSGGAAYFLAGRTLKPIEEVLEDQKRFVADASHELRTPLTTMKTQLEVNLRNKKLGTEPKEILESNLEEVNKLSYLSEKLLRLSRYEQPGMSFSKVSLKEILEQVIRGFESAAKAKKIAITQNLDEADIQGNSSALLEAFGTILDNAIKYSPREGKVEVSLQTQVDKSVVKVQDFGIGIKASDLPHIFNRFYRADQSRSKEKTDGFGLGLSIAKIVFDKHKAKTEVDSNVDSGTTFTISFQQKS